MTSLIQIGCNVGDEYIFDLIEDKRINLCVFIDANEKALQKCKENLEKFFENKDVDWEVSFEYIPCAISNTGLPKIKLNIPIGNSVSSHSSIFSEFPTISEHKNGFESIEVKNYSINDIFDNYELRDITYLFIDVEGCDKEIIRSIDWAKYFIHNIKFEFTHWDGWQGFDSENLRHLIFFLLMNKYKVYQSSATDLTASRILNWYENYNDEKD